MLPGAEGGPAQGGLPLGATPFLVQQTGLPAGVPGFAGGGGTGSAELLQHLGWSLNAASTSGSDAFGGSGSYAPADQQAALSGQMPSGTLPYYGGLPMVAGPATTAGLHPSSLQPGDLSTAQLHAFQLPAGSLPVAAAPVPVLQPQPQLQQRGSGAGAAKPTKTRQRRPYKPPDVVQAERKQKAEVQEHIRRLEQQLGRAQKELEQLQQENKTLHRKAQVLSRHTSFRKCMAAMTEELMQSAASPVSDSSPGLSASSARQPDSPLPRCPPSPSPSPSPTCLSRRQSMTMSKMDWSRQSASQSVLNSAERGLPGPEVLERLRGMSLEEAMGHYNSVVSRVRGLLRHMEQGPDRAVAEQELESIFTLGSGPDSNSTFGYLQVVNPPVFAQLMDTKLDPTSPVERSDPAHWRSVLSSMMLSEEQEAQLIILLQSHLQQAEKLVQQKSRVMQQLAEELNRDLLSLDLSTSGELADGGSDAGAAAADSGSGGAAEGSSLESRLSGQGSSHGPMQAKDELDRLIQLEYWLKFDFTGCVRKLLPAHKQALCMVSSWPYYPDQKQLEAAIKEKAGQLWDQLQRSNSN